MARNCVETNPPITPTRCVECPHIDPIPPSTTVTAVIGWNAGANSVDMLDGDVHTVFQVPAQAFGIVIGFKGSRDFQTTPSLVDHAFYFTNAGGHDFWYVYERGVRMNFAQVRHASDEFEIRRVDSIVRYYCNGLLVHTSQRPSTGPVLVNACLYATGDKVA